MMGKSGHLPSYFIFPENSINAYIYGRMEYKNNIIMIGPVAKDEKISGRAKL